MSKAPRRTGKKPAASKRPATAIHRCEADTAHGLEDMAREEIGRMLGLRVKMRAQQEDGVVRFDVASSKGVLRELLQLKTVLAIFLMRTFAVPRPKGLLGDEHFRTLLKMIETARELMPDGYKTLHLSAAGSESSVMARLKEELAVKTGLAIAGQEGDLLLRLRRAKEGEGWDALVRLSPRPLATRAWRVCRLEGALNATIAHAMALLTEPKPEDVYLNLMCGSGTLLVERLLAGEAARVIGCDTDEAALACAKKNVKAAGYSKQVELERWDVRELPLADGTVDVLSVDLPFGHLMGSHEENVTLYPAVLREAWRVAKAEGRFVAISHEVRLMTGLLSRSAEWEVAEVRRVTLGGLHPRIYVLKKRS